MRTGWNTIPSEEGDANEEALLEMDTKRGFHSRPLVRVFYDMTLQFDKRSPCDPNAPYVTINALVYAVFAM